jgi:glycosyltransferase involved in cell wall biosynthesis
VGPLSAPSSGRSVATAAFVQRLRDRYPAIEVIDTAAGEGARLEPARRILAYMAAYRRLLFGPAPHSVYLAFPDGEEIALALVVIYLAAARRTRVIIHHNSRRYLTRPSRLVRAALRADRWTDVLHVLQCETLVAHLVEVYGPHLTITLTNAFAVSRSRLPSSPGSGAPTIGYFGTISRSKGFDHFIAIANHLLSRAVVKVKVAGRVPGMRERLQIGELLQRYPEKFLYAGELYGEEKFHFLESLDLLVFPSRYESEAEPLVLLEAMSVGTPFVASNLGCIPAVASVDTCVSTDISSISSAVRTVLRSQADPNGRARTTEAFDRLSALGKRQLNTVISYAMRGTP